MIKEISTVRLADVRDEEVQGLLRTSKPLHDFFHMNMDEAKWKPNSVASTLSVDMTIPVDMQGWGRIAHGGGIDFILHDITGFASLLFVRSERPNHVVLGRDIEVSYRRPLPIGQSVEVFAAIEMAEDDRVITSGYIRPIGSVGVDDKYFARAKLTTQTVDAIHTSSHV